MHGVNRLKMAMCCTKYYVCNKTIKKLYLIKLSALNGKVFSPLFKKKSCLILLLVSVWERFHWTEYHYNSKLSTYCINLKYNNNHPYSASRNDLSISNLKIAKLSQAPTIQSWAEFSLILTAQISQWNTQVNWGIKIVLLQI